MLALLEATRFVVLCEGSGKEYSRMLPREGWGSLQDGSLVGLLPSRFENLLMSPPDEDRRWWSLRLVP